ncbi:YitT family protein [Treponema pedis]|uniref:YitT family protein n=1 Tax=Treponema pedis TaxID=409322 RepID=UPI00040BCDE4|nr:YitT family protein [Treponema pedis]
MKEKIASFFYIVAGVLMIASGIHFFLLPSKLSLGGATGMALVLSNYIPLSTGALLVVVNIVLFALGFLIIGNKFGAKTVCASLGLSGAVWLLEIFLPIKEPIVNDIFLQLIIAVLLYGGGVGIVLNQYASTGGSDIFAMILQKYTGLDLGKGCLLTDFIITVFAAFAYGKEIALFSLVGVIINGLVIDSTIDGMNSSKYCVINTDNPEALCSFLVQLGRSANVYKATGAYTKAERSVIQTVISRRDFVKLKTYLSRNDEKAFMVVTNAHSVFGWHWRRIGE